MNNDGSVEKFGVHLMFDGYNANVNLLNDLEHLKQVLYSLPEKMDMHIIAEPVLVEVGPQNSKDPGGISGFVMIAESHISLHTFPNRGFVTADIYTCQNNLDTAKFTELLAEAFGTTDFDIQIVDRGLRYSSKDIH